MNCILCRETGHTAVYCNSIRAKTIDEAVHHWVSNRLEQIYSSEEKNEPILWLMDSPHFKRLSLGDLIYLNRAIYESEDRQELIALFLAEKTLLLFYEKKAKKCITDYQIYIDYKYWGFVMLYGKEHAEEWRRMNMFIRRRKKMFDKVGQCPICLDEEMNNARLLNCGHTFCSTCTERCVKTNPLCALCREPIRVIYS